MDLDMKEVLEQAQKMQEKMQQIQEDLGNLKVIGESGNGLVRIILNGRHEALKAMLSDTLLNKPGQEHKQYLEELIVAAFNGGVDQIEKQSQLQLQGLASSLNLPDNLVGNREE